MSNLANYGAYTQQNTLTELQVSNLEGFKQRSTFIDILFDIFIILIIGYLFWTRNTNK